MVAKFISLDWIPGGTAFEQGRNGQAPKNAIKEPGGREYKKYDDKYLVWVQNKMVLNVRAEDGNIYKQDIFKTVKWFAPKKRFTKKFRDELRHYLVQCEFTIDRGEIINLSKLLGTYFQTS